MGSTGKLWVLRPHDKWEIERLSASLQLPPIVAQLLLNRGLNKVEEARAFLEAPLVGLQPPEKLPGATRAAEILFDAVRQKRRICVYGDYDVDGLTGTVILWQVLKLLGANVDYYVPHRLDEGYGLNASALEQISRTGTSLVVTVDCGVGSVAAAEVARTLGLELIITDHHALSTALPQAVAIVHPRLPGFTYPYGELSGSGVAFKVAWALCQVASGSNKVEAHLREYLLDAVALAALGMIADVMPLRDENRVFVRHGLKRLSSSRSIGVKALLEVAKLNDKADLTAMDVAFFVAPRLNAAGRLGCARLVVELLTTTSRERAVDLARFLEDQNGKRQLIEKKILAEAKEQILALDFENSSALILASPAWHAGVIGIVAGRLVEQYCRPVLMIAINEEAAMGQGSGRSVPGFHLHEALQACTDNLLSHGGHSAAAGFRISHSLIGEFREKFTAYAAKMGMRKREAPTCNVDAEVPLSSLTLGLVNSLSQLEPYGAGNPRPMLLAGPLQVAEPPRRVGRGELHLSFRVRQQNSIFRAIAFRMGERADELMTSDGWCNLVFTPYLNDWNGYRTVQLEVHDFQPGKQAALL